MGSVALCRCPAYRPILWGRAPWSLDALEDNPSHMTKETKERIIREFLARMDARDASEGVPTPVPSKQTQVPQ